MITDVNPSGKEKKMEANGTPDTDSLTRHFPGMEGGSGKLAVFPSLPDGDMGVNTSSTSPTAMVPASSSQAGVHQSHLESGLASRVAFEPAFCQVPRRGSAFCLASYPKKPWCALGSPLRRRHCGKRPFGSPGAPGGTQGFAEDAHPC